MTDSPTGQQRLKAGLPQGWSIARLARSRWLESAQQRMMSALSIPRKEGVAIAVFIAGSKVPEEKTRKRDAVASAVVRQCNSLLLCKSQNFEALNGFQGST